MEFFFLLVFLQVKVNNTKKFFKSWQSEGVKKLLVD